MSTENKETVKTFYVHWKVNTSEEYISEKKTPKKGYVITFSGTQQECAKYVTR